MALAMDKFLYLMACPLCVLTRYVFGLIAVEAQKLVAISLEGSVG